MRSEHLNFNVNLNVCERHSLRGSFGAGKTCWMQDKLWSCLHLKAASAFCSLSDSSSVAKMSCLSEPQGRKDCLQYMGKNNDIYRTF